MAQREIVTAIENALETAHHSNPVKRQLDQMDVLVCAGYLQARYNRDRP